MEEGGGRGGGGREGRIREREGGREGGKGKKKQEVTKLEKKKGDNQRGEAVQEKGGES